MHRIFSTTCAVASILSSTMAFANGTANQNNGRIAAVKVFPPTVHTTHRELACPVGTVLVRSDNNYLCARPARQTNVVRSYGLIIYSVEQRFDKYGNPIKVRTSKQRRKSSSRPLWWTREESNLMVGGSGYNID